MIAGAVALRGGGKRWWKRTFFYRGFSRGMMIMLFEIAIAIDAPYCEWNLRKKAEVE